MKASRFALVVVAGCCLMRSEMVHAQNAAVPFAMDKQYSTDMVISTNKGQVITQKLYNDGGKVHMITSIQGMQGTQIEMIVRPDLQKVYQVTAGKKLAVEMPYNPIQFTSPMVSASGPQGKFELIGPDTLQGEACLKYKVTPNANDANKVGTLWIDAATKAPVKMMADDKSYTMYWKNYKAGPQDASLFEVPKDFKVMGIPGSAGPAGTEKSGGVMLP